MIDVEWIKDEAVSVFPEGVPVEAVPEFAEMIVRLVEIASMKWTLQNGRWVGPRGQVDERPTNGCREIADAGEVMVNIGTARPKKGDLKPSESLLRDMNASANAPMLKMREDYRARLAELDRELANGKTEVHPEATPGNAVSIVGDNGRRMVVPEDRLTAGDRLRLEQEHVAREAAYAAPKKLEPVESGKDGATAEERLRIASVRAGVPVGNGMVEVARVVDRVPEGAVVIPAVPDQRYVSMADFEAWEGSPVPCIAKGR